MEEQGLEEIKVTKYVKSCKGKEFAEDRDGLRVEGTPPIMEKIRKTSKYH